MFNCDERRVSEKHSFQCDCYEIHIHACVCMHNVCMCICVCVMYKCGSHSLVARLGQLVSPSSGSLTPFSCDLTTERRVGFLLALQCDLVPEELGFDISFLQF